MANAVKNFDSVKNYINEIEYLKDEFFSYSREELLKEVGKLNFHYGSESYPINKSLKPGETGVSWVEDDQWLAILAEEGRDMWEDTPQNIYALWKDGRMSENGWNDFHPWQDPEVFCRAMAALQNLVPQGKDVIIPAK